MKFAKCTVRGEVFEDRFDSKTVAVLLFAYPLYQCRSYGILLPYAIPLFLKRKMTTLNTGGSGFLGR